MLPAYSEHSLRAKPQVFPQASASRIYEHLSAAPMPMRVLMIEDDESDAAMVRVVLDAMDTGYTLEHLRDGADAVPYLEQKGVFSDKPTPDLILLDLGLPGLDGFEILAELAEMPPHRRQIPIAILTGHEHFEHLKKCYNLLIADYVTKPCNTEKLWSVLRHAQRMQRGPLRKHFV